jgi:hypothetical protein
MPGDHCDRTDANEEKKKQDSVQRENRREERATDLQVLDGEGESVESMNGDVVLGHVLGAIVDGRERTVAAEKRFDVHVSSNEVDEEWIVVVDLRMAATEDDIASGGDLGFGNEVLSSSVVTVATEGGSVVPKALTGRGVRVGLGANPDLEKGKVKIRSCLVGRGFDGEEAKRTRRRSASIRRW